MKAWTTATAAGTCSFDRAHTWQEGARIFRVQGTSWSKNYCPACAIARHGAPEDTGEVLDVTDAPRYPQPLRALADKVAQRFDPKMAAAGRDDE